MWSFWTHPSYTPLIPNKLILLEGRQIVQSEYRGCVRDWIHPPLLYKHTKRRESFCPWAELPAVGSALAELIAVHLSSVESVSIDHSTQRIRRSQKIRTIDRIILSKALWRLERPGWISHHGQLLELNQSPSQYSGRTRTYSKLSRWDYNFFWQLKGTSGLFGRFTSGGKPKVIIHQDSPQVLWEKGPEEKFTKVVSRGRIISSSSAGDPETFCNSGTTGDSRPEQGTDQRTLTR